MTFLAFTGLTIFLASLPLGLFVYYKNPKSSLNKAYLNLNLSITIYGISYFLWQISKNTGSQIFWFKILGIGIILIEPAFLHFVFNLTDKMQKKKNFLITCYGINLLFIYFNLSGLFYVGFIPKHNLGLWPIPSFIFSIYLAWWFFQVFYGFAYFLIGLKESVGIKHNQIKYCAIAGGIGFVGAVTNWPGWYNINFPPYLNILIALHVSVVAYAILRYQLMDIEVLIKKTLVFAGMFAFSFGVIVATVLITQDLLPQYFAISRRLSMAISILIIIFSLRPIENFLINITNKYLFQKKYEYKQILKAFIEEVITVLNLDEVVNSTLKLFDETLHPYTAGIFILNKAEDKYQLYGSFGLEEKNIALTSESKLITFLKNTKHPAVIKQINGIVGVNPEVSSEMASLKAVIVLPLTLHTDLIGFISLGRKKSDEEYAKDDLDVLLDLASTESIAIANAQLLTEAAQAERRAAIGTMAAGIHHEIGNPLNIMATRIQLFKLARQKGLFQGKSNEDILNEAESVLDDCLKQSGRISDTTKKLANFAKPSKEFKPELITVSQEIDEAMAVIGYDLELDRIKIKKEISSDSNKILADKHEAQQIFFNIIRNAAQAIEGVGTITIRVFTTSGGKVCVEIQDTGKGIPEDKKHRMFEPFFTTKGTKGTGLGLSIVRQLMWRNKGEISFKSQVGIGTTFILEFPKGE